MIKEFMTLDERLSNIEKLLINLNSVKKEIPAAQPENLTLDQAVVFLHENALPTTKAQLYKLTSQGEIPVFKVGKRLVFSRKELLNWIESRKIVKVSSNVLASEKLAISARRRERARR